MTSVRLGRTVWRLGSAIWLGSIVFFSFVVAPQIFYEISMPQSGRLITHLFPPFYAIGLWGGGLAMIGAFLVAWFLRARQGWIVFSFSGAAWILMVYANALLVRMQHLNPASGVFHALHHESIVINGIIMLCLIIGIVFDAWNVGLGGK